jgi:hypothetical protein
MPDYSDNGLERAEQIDHRSYKRQGVEKIPTIHMGAAASEMERNGIRTEKGNINHEIKQENLLIRVLRHGVEKFQKSMKELFSRKAELTKLIEEQQANGDSLVVKLMRFHENGGKFNQSSAPYLRNLKNIRGLQNVATAIAFLQSNNISTAEELQAKLNAYKQAHNELKTSTENKKTRITELDSILINYDSYKKHKPVFDEYEAIKSERKRARFYETHREEITACKSAKKKLSDKLTPKAWLIEREQLDGECGANNQKRMLLEDSIAQMETITRNMESLERYEWKQEQEQARKKEHGLE